jgi:hypothetical protein
MFCSLYELDDFDSKQVGGGQHGVIVLIGFGAFM